MNRRTATNQIKMDRFWILQATLKYWEFRIYGTLYLTHCSPETPKRVTDKKWRPKSDAAERGVWSGSPLLAISSTMCFSEYLKMYSLA